MSEKRITRNKWEVHSHFLNQLVAARSDLQNNFLIMTQYEAVLVYCSQIAFDFEPEKSAQVLQILAAEEKNLGSRQNSFHWRSLSTLVNQFMVCRKL